MSVVRLKPGVQFPVLAPAGVRILSAIDFVAQASGRDLTITSAGEARGRLATDPHMTGEAMDVSVAGLLPGEIVALVTALRSHLGPAFTVLYETPAAPLDTVLASIATVNPNATAVHIHCQRKKNTVFPAADTPHAA